MAIPRRLPSPPTPSPSALGEGAVDVETGSQMATRFDVRLPSPGSTGEGLGVRVYPSNDTVHNWNQSSGGLIKPFTREERASGARSKVIGM
jgi:hypothetical protein